MRVANFRKHIGKRFNKAAGQVIEIGLITGLGATVEYGAALGRDFTIADLFGRGFDAVFLGLGAMASRKMKVVGEELDGVWAGVPLLLSEGGEPPPPRKALTRDTGARALRSITEELMVDLMYYLPEETKPAKYAITEDIVEGRASLMAAR